MGSLMETKFMRSVLSVWAWIALALSVLVVVPIVFLVWLVTRWFDPARYRAGFAFRQLAVMHQKLNPLWKFRISGTPPANPRNPYVVVANHESFVDILLIAHLPFEMKWMSKAEIFRLPLVGWGMQMAGDIRLERGDRTSRRQAIDASLDRLGKKVSVMIFPEGTRSRDGELQKFKNGAFRIAIEAGVPILPLALAGTRDALVKHDWRYGRTDAEVRILDPIPTDGMTVDDIASLRDQTRQAISDALDELRAERANAA